MKSWRGTIYTVEEVSDLLGIPRPTLYRYLREYSIPHLRRAGRISIPEDSFDLIREARDLHKEGLGTESVRRLLRERRSPDPEDLNERLDTLSETLKGLQERSAADDTLPSSPALRTVLARQSLLISAVFNLTEMMEELLLASGKPRKTVFGELGGQLREVTPLREHAASRQLERPEPVVTATKSGPRRALPASAARAAPPPGRDFGSLRRRRRGALALLAVVVVGALLVWAIPTLRETYPGTLSDSSGTEAQERSPNLHSEGSPEQRNNGAAGAPEAHGAVGSTERSAIPDISGRGVEEAARALSEAGYVVAAIQTEASAQKAGTATGTRPPAGTDAKPGRPVTLVMSSGPGTDPPPR